MARRGSGRSSSEMDPPRRVRSLDTVRHPTPIQKRHIMPTTALRSRCLPKRRDREAYREGRSEAHRKLKMGLKGFLRAEARRLEARHRPPSHQQPLPKEDHEKGDHTKPFIVRPDDHRVSFDLNDGFYALAIHPKNREAFTIILNGQLLQLCALLVGCSLSPYIFQKLTDVFVNKLRDPESTAATRKSR